MSEEVQDSRSAHERASERLTTLLRRQFELIGKPEGGFPFEPPYAAPKARGALLGTALMVVAEELGHQPTYRALLAAAVDAFTLAFGHEHGASAARQTIAEVAEGNREMIGASDRAANDIQASATDTSITPDAFYLAVSGKL